MENIIKFVDEDGEEIEFSVLEQTRVAGVDYLLVTPAEDADEEEAEAYIMKDVSAENETEACYEFVEDDNELNALMKVFSELLDDTDELV